MSDLQIREMSRDDIPAATAVMATGEWPQRRSFLEWALANPTIEPLAGLVDGRLVATGIGTRNGQVGWVGMIFVDPAMRRRGYGRAITEEVCRRLTATGCRTLTLIASNLGRPVYSQMDFRIEAWYQIWEAPTTPDEPKAVEGTRLRPVTAADVDRIALLDRRATGEDRRGLFATLTDRSWLLETDDGSEILGFLAQERADSGTIAALAPDHAARLLDLLRKSGHGQVERVRAAVVRPADGEVKESVRKLLADQGWTPAFETPRMLRGPSYDWDPSLIWGILGFSFG